jgi:PAS domain S-box-containing protein
MISFAQGCLLSAFVSLIVGILIYGENPTHVVNRMFLVVCGILLYYEFTLIEFVPAGDADAAFQWLRFGAFWYLLPVAVFHFSIIYANLRVRRLVLYSMYGFAVLFSLLEGLVAPYELFKMPWGWAYHYTGYYQYVQVLWVIVPTIAALVVLIRRYHVVKSREEKTGVAYVFFGFLIPVVTGISVTVLPFLTSIDVPDLTTPAAAIGFLLVGYAVFRYGIHILTARAAADEIVSAMTDPLFLVNPSMEIIDLNRAALQLFGYDAPELAGKPLNALMQDPATTKTLQGSNPPGNLETEFLTKQGRALPVSVSKSVIMTKQGNLIGYVMICRDVTERKRLEAQLSEAQKLGAIGEAAAMVGHDLRNPLQAMSNTLYLVKRLMGFEKAEDRKEGVRLLSMLNDEIQYMDKIVSDLQDYARPLAAAPVETSLPDLVRTTVSNVKIPGNVEVTVNVGAGLSNVKLDPALFRRVLANLILNAVQAMPKGGGLTISALKHKDSLIVDVQDTGAGIPPESMEKIFNPFFTTKAQGQGLGLSVCKRLMETQGGTITVSSEVGKGSTFTLTVPTNRTNGTPEGAT